MLSSQRTPSHPSLSTSASYRNVWIPLYQRLFVINSGLLSSIPSFCLSQGPKKPTENHRIPSIINFLEYCVIDFIYHAHIRILERLKTSPYNYLEYIISTFSYSPIITALLYGCKLSICSPRTDFILYKNSQKTPKHRAHAFGKI